MAPFSQLLATNKYVKAAAFDEAGLTSPISLLCWATTTAGRRCRLGSTQEFTAVLSRMGGDEGHALVESWYQQDDNALPRSIC